MVICFVVNSEQTDRMLFVMPPVGVGYYAACTVGRVNPNGGLKAIWVYMLALLIGLAVVTLTP